MGDPLPDLEIALCGRLAALAAIFLLQNKFFIDIYH
jgi:hypothetical protein